MRCCVLRALCRVVGGEKKAKSVHVLRRLVVVGRLGLEVGDRDHLVRRALDCQGLAVAVVRVVHAEVRGVARALMVR